MSGVIGLLPCAGKYARMQYLPYPKEMLVVGSATHEDHIELVVDSTMHGLECSGVKEIVMVSRQRFMLAYHLERRFPRLTLYNIVDPCPRGLLTSIDLAYEIAYGKRTIMALPDSIISNRDACKQVVDYARMASCDLVLGLFRTNQPSRFGMVEQSCCGKIVSHADKPRQWPSDLMWGLACWESRFWNLLHELARVARQRDFEAVFGVAIDKAIASGLTVKGIVIQGEYTDVGTPRDLLRINGADELVCSDDTRKVAE